MRGTYLAIAGASALLLSGCGEGANKSASAGNSAGANEVTSANMAAPAPAPAAAPAPAGGEPAEPYRRYFNERWSRSGAPVTAAQVTAMLQKQTPQELVNALYGNGENSRWDTVASGIAKGDPEWLAVAVGIARGTDAGTSDDFGMAVQDALTTNPAGALRLLTQIEMGVGACAENGFEVPPEQARIYFQTATAAVEAVTDPALQQIKTQCVAALRKGAAEYPGM